MAGFLKEIIFSRFLNHDDVEQSQVWRDCSQCWICEKWDKATVQFFEPDMIQDPQFQKIFDISYKAAKKKLESGEPVVMEDEDEEAILNRLMRLRRQEEYKFKNKKFIEGGSSTIREVNRDDFEGAEYLIKA